MEQVQTQSQTQTYPKLIKAQMLPTQELRLKFDNGEVRYMVAALRHTILDQKHRIMGILAGTTMSWMGNEIVISDDGALTINGKEHYTAEELYTKSTDNNYMKEEDKYGAEMAEKYSFKKRA